MCFCQQAIKERKESALLRLQLSSSLSHSRSTTNPKPSLTVSIPDSPSSPICCYSPPAAPAPVVVAVPAVVAEHPDYEKKLLFVPRPRMVSLPPAAVPEVLPSPVQDVPYVPPAAPCTCPPDSKGRTFCISPGPVSTGPRMEDPFSALLGPDWPINRNWQEFAFEAIELQPCVPLDNHDTCDIYPCHMCVSSFF